jgi:DNA invertase Pin-like site-specific DNA recombinase
MIYGYARVSTVDQDLSIQHAALTAAGCTVVRSEKVTGTSTDGREEPATLLEFLREGDALVVTRIDRLARSLRDLQNIVHDLRQRGVTLKATEQPIDTSTAAGKCFLDMLGVFAEFETKLRRERRQGPARLDRRRTRAQNESARPRRHGHRQRARHRPAECLPRAGSEIVVRLYPRMLWQLCLFHCLVLNLQGEKSDLNQEDFARRPAGSTSNARRGGNALPANWFEDFWRE